jgi:hypothetical protein
LYKKKISQRKLKKVKSNSFDPEILLPLVNSTTSSKSTTDITIIESESSSNLDTSIKIEKNKNKIKT